MVERSECKCGALVEMSGCERGAAAPTTHSTSSHARRSSPRLAREPHNFSSSRRARRLLAQRNFPMATGAQIKAEVELMLDEQADDEPLRMSELQRELESR